MPGHVRELTWNDVSDKINRRLGKLLEFVLASENEYQELLGLWAVHGDSDQAVADQLFGGEATEAQVQMVTDARDAMAEAHKMHDSADLTAIRKMT